MCVWTSSHEGGGWITTYIGQKSFMCVGVHVCIFVCGCVVSTILDRLDFVRDVTAYVLVVALVIGICFDGKVSLYHHTSITTFASPLTAILDILIDTFV